MEPALLAFVEAHVAAASCAAIPSAAVGAALHGRLADRECRVATTPVADLAPGTVDAVVLADNELGTAGEDADRLIAEAAEALQAGGVMIVATQGSLAASLAEGEPEHAAGYRAGELAQALGHRGLTVEHVAAPGVAAELAGAPVEWRPELDREPGVVDAGRTVAVAARRQVDGGRRTEAFLASLPLKVVSAAALCRDEHGRMLCVFDVYKQHWTIPGGIVDADEDPRSGAAREAWEEAGLAVTPGSLAGLFSASWPDRLVVVYEARPVEAGAVPAPRFPHEISAAEWMDVSDALGRLGSSPARQVRCCLEAPGETWRL
jgi:8-oxo-dGTP pyrophosphatase MutT (NUDIX family)